MAFFKIAFGNLLRNYRRTISMLLAFLVGMVAIVFANGFHDGAVSNMAKSFINRTNGHFRLQHVEYSNYIETDMERILMRDPERLKDELKKNSHVVEAIMRIPISGLAGSEDNSTYFSGFAYEMERLYTVLPLFNDEMAEGKRLKPGDPTGAVLGKALADSINAKIGDELVIISNSIHAEQNAILIDIRGLIELPKNRQLEQNLIVTSTDQVQNDLLDLDSGTTELLVRIDDEKNLESVIEWVNDYFVEKGEPWVAVPWHDDALFGMITGIFRGLRNLISIILSLLVGIVISNAMLMSVYERVREIGTIRAVGAEKKHVYRIFYAEAVLIILLGCLVGLMAGAFITWLAGQIGFSVPGIAQGATLRPVVEFGSLMKAAIIPILFAGIAVLFPIRSSCKMDVVDALNYR